MKYQIWTYSPYTFLRCHNTRWHSAGSGDIMILDFLFFEAALSTSCELFKCFVLVKPELNHSFVWTLYLGCWGILNSVQVPVFLCPQTRLSEIHRTEILVLGIGCQNHDRLIGHFGRSIIDYNRLFLLALFWNFNLLTIELNTCPKSIFKNWVAQIRFDNPSIFRYIFLFLHYHYM